MIHRNLPVSHCVSLASESDSLGLADTRADGPGRAGRIRHHRTCPGPELGENTRVLEKKNEIITVCHVIRSS